MNLAKILPFFLAWTVAGATASPVSPTCQGYYVSAPDGYVNVRTSGQVKSDNIKAVLPSGIAVMPKRRSGRWQSIQAPLTGWLAQTQVSYLPCERGQRLLWEVGIPAMTRLGRQAQNGHRQAAETVIKMAPYVDGVVQEVYGEVLADWAKQNPQFLVSVLSRQTALLRQSVINSLDFGLGATDSVQRQAFENFIRGLSQTNIVRQDWDNRQGVYPPP